MRWSRRRCGQIRRGLGASRAASGPGEHGCQKGSYFPAVQGSFDATRNRDAVGVLQPTLNPGRRSTTCSPSVTVSYVPTCSARIARVESLSAQAEASRYQLDATYLTLTANV